jgi:hypothetical protein
VNLDAFRDRLAALSERIDDYREGIRKAGFSSCLVNEDWIQEQCETGNIETHQRYLAEFAKELLLGGNAGEVLYTDAINCKSLWLNNLKAKRFAEHGSVEAIQDQSQRLYLGQLSPCLREVIRQSASQNPADRKRVKEEQQEFVRRREREFAYHHDDISRLSRDIPREVDEANLQAWLAQSIHDRLAKCGAVIKSMVRPEGSVNVVVIDVAEQAVLALNPNMTLRAAGTSDKRPSGTVSVGFRLVEKGAIESPVFARERQLVLPLSHLLPNQFNDYGLFEGPEELSLNVLAWNAALDALIPDSCSLLRQG